MTPASKRLRSLLCVIALGIFVASSLLFLTSYYHDQGETVNLHVGLESLESTPEFRADFEAPRKPKLILIGPPIGGLGDRLRAVSNMYLLAMSTGRQLVVDTDEFFDGGMIPQTEFPSSKAMPNPPMAIEKLWIPYNSATEIQKQDLRGPGWDRPEGTKGTFLGTNLLAKESALVWRIGANELQPQHHLPTFKALHEARILWHWIFRATFAPSPKIVRLLDLVERDHFPGRTGHYLIGLQIRTGDNKDIIDPQFNAWDKDLLYFEERIDPLTISCFTNPALRFWEDLPEETKATKYPHGPVFFVTGDHPGVVKNQTEAFQSRGYRAFETSKYAGDIKHIGLSVGTKLRALLDWWLLTRMDGLVISPSGFGQTAAVYSCVPVYQYAYFEKTHECPKQRFKLLEEGLCSVAQTLPYIIVENL